MRNDAIKELNKEIKDRNSHSKKGAAVGAAVGSVGGPIGIGLGMLLGGFIGSEGEEEEKKRHQESNRYIAKIHKESIAYTSWIESMQNQIIALQNIENESEIKLLVTTNKSGEIIETYVIKEKTVT